MHGYKFNAYVGGVVIAAVTAGVYPLYRNVGLLEVVVDAIAELKDLESAS